MPELLPGSSVYRALVGDGTIGNMPADTALVDNLYTSLYYVGVISGHRSQEAREGKLGSV